MKTSDKIKGLAALAVASVAVSAGSVFRNVVVRKKKADTDPFLPPDAVDELGKGALLKEANRWLDRRENEIHMIRSFDGLLLQGEFFAADETTRDTVILFHGYRNNHRREYAVMAKFLLEAGYNVLMVDERAHGASEGNYVGFGILDREDVYRWVHYVNRRFHGNGNIFLHGISMGGASVLMASSLNLPSSVKGIVADCAYTSPKEEFIHVMRTRGKYYSRVLLGTANLICKWSAGYSFDDYSSVKAVAQTKVPILIIHGTQDDFVPVRMAKEIYRACISRKELYLVEGAGHAESYYLEKGEYEKRMLSFFDKCLKGTRK